MKKLITALAVTTALGTGGAMAQYYGGGYGNEYYGAGVGGGYGADLGYGYGYGAGLLGGTIDQSLYGVGIGGLYGTEIQGATGEQIGEVLRVVRNCNIYAVVNVNPDWLEGNQREIVVPLGQMVVTQDGVAIQGLTRNNVDNYPVYRAGIGLTEIGAGGGGNVGGLYGATEGWGACQQFGSGGLGTGIGMQAGIGGVGGGIGVGAGGVDVEAGVGEGVGEGVGADVGAGGVGAGVGTGLGTGGAIGGVSNQNMLEFSVDALEGTPVYGAEDAALGQIDRLVRSNNAYVVMQIDTGWFDSGGTAVVPLQRFVSTGDGLMLPGVTEETIGEYSPYGGVYGDYWGAGYAELDTGYYNDIGDIYAYGE